MHHFSTLGADGIQTVYTLRCAFAHDVALININVPARTHHFALVVDDATPMITHPATAWDGDIATITPENTTVVNLELLGDMVEGVYQQLVKEAAAGNLVNRLPTLALLFGEVHIIYLILNKEKLEKKTQAHNLRNKSISKKRRIIHTIGLPLLGFIAGHFFIN